MAASAFRSCRWPMTALATTITMITMASRGRPSAPSISQAADDTTVAASNSSTTGSITLSASRRHQGAAASPAAHWGR